MAIYLQSYKKYFAQYGCVIGDEAHLFKAKSLTGYYDEVQSDVKYRFGLQVH